jgi:glycogen(starch) synthase
VKIGITAAFYPSLGGIEAIAGLLAENFSERGHEVTVITPIAGGTGADSLLSYRVVRRPGMGRLLKEMSRLDVVLQLGVMLRTAWAAALINTPVVISHQAWFERRHGRLLPVEWMKQRFSALCGNVVASRALLTEPVGRTVIVPNCYDDKVFQLANLGPRKGGLIFIGRLVSDKGADLLLLALAKLKDEKLSPSLTIVGDGPELANLERMVDALELRSQVTFSGRQRPDRVAALLNQHRILVVPSRWEEPFGIVALEGIACGCEVVASAGGGLKDIIGPFGSLFTRNDLGGLCAALRNELGRNERNSEDVGSRARFLEQFKPAHMVNRYLESLMSRVDPFVDPSAMT